jgi:hypothetical protein
MKGCELLEIVKNSLIVSAFIVGLIKLSLSWKTFWKSNDISRRKVALDSIREWTRNLTKNGSIARKIVETFNEEQCKLLKNEEEIKIDSKLSKSLKIYFNEDMKTENGFCIINEGQSSVLRWEIITYLNSLETVLTSWRHSISDREIIEEQFSYLYNEQENHTTLEKFRRVIGIHTYPSIQEFINELKKNTNKIKEGKKK